MPTPATIQRSSRRFEPGVMAPISARSTIGRRPDRTLVAHAAASPVEALVASYPVVHRLVGDESFRAMAHRFVASEPARRSGLLHRGESFPRFLRGLGKTASIEYVADIAELEMARSKACQAADELPLDAQAVAALPAEARVVLHPSVLLVASRFPIVTIWKNNQLDGEGAVIERWRAECALVARPFHEVEVHCLSRGGHAFICALAEGHTIAMAIEAGRAVMPDFDTAANLALLAEANIVVGLRNKEAVS